MSTPIGTGQFIELLTRLLSNRTDPGEGHVILSSAEFDKHLRWELKKTRHAGELGDRALQALRNQLVHSVVTTNYDRLLELTLTEHHRTRRPSTKSVPEEVVRAALAEARTGDVRDQWLEVAVAVADGFVQRLIEDPDMFEKLDEAEARRIGIAAADNALAASHWAQVVGDRLDTSAVTQLLGVSRQALAKRQTSGSILGILGNGTTWYPTWQFDSEKGDARPEIRDIIGAFRDRLDHVEPLVIASWATTPQDEDLDGLTPAHWIRLGRDTERLRRAAERAASRLAR
jgi:hypothetical protein